MRVRYDTKAKRGLKVDGRDIQETRREYNERFKQPAPEVEIPEGGEHLWEWYWHLSGRLRRTRDGAAEPIPPSEYLAWKAATRAIVYPHEYAILTEMDAAFCDEMNVELDDSIQRATQNAADNKGKG